MDESSKETSRLVGEETQKQIIKVFDEIHLIDYLPKAPEAKAIAIFGAGAFPVEVEPLTNYFIAHQLGKPKITAFDINTGLRIFYDYYFEPKNVDLEYRSGVNGDVSNPDTLGEEKYDMIVIRNPDVHSSEHSWMKSFENAFLHLKSEGIILATTDMHQNFVRSQLAKNGKIEKTYPIPKMGQSIVYFGESDLYIARKAEK